jgi:predicted MFS family arabinose efflux permease
MVDTTHAMNEGIKPNRLFLLSCIALCVTAMTFAIRAGMLNDLGAEFNLTKAQLGWTASMAFSDFQRRPCLGGYCIIP